MTRRRRGLAWFLPQMPDVLGLLSAQGRLTVEGAEAFDRWAAGAEQEATRVRALEHAADGARRAVVAALRSAFTTPVEPEDLYELSERLDAATAAADRAIRRHRGIERVYRRAMSELVLAPEIGEVTAKRELYRRYARIGDAVEHVANRVWYAVVKQG